MEKQAEITPIQSYTNLSRLNKRTPESLHVATTSNRNKKQLVDQFYNIEKTPNKVLTAPLSDETFKEFVDQGGVRYVTSERRDQFELEEYLLCIDEIVNSMYEPNSSPLKAYNRVIGDVTQNITPRKQEIVGECNGNRNNVRVLVEYIQDLKIETEKIAQYLAEIRTGTKNSYDKKVDNNSKKLENLKKVLNSLEERLNKQRNSITDAKAIFNSSNEKLLIAEQVQKRIQQYILGRKKKRLQYTIFGTSILVMVLLVVYNYWYI